MERASNSNRPALLKGVTLPEQRASHELVERDDRYKVRAGASARWTGRAPQEGFKQPSKPGRESGEVGSLNLHSCNKWYAQKVVAPTFDLLDAPTVRGSTYGSLPSLKRRTSFRTWPT